MALINHPSPEGGGATPEPQGVDTRSYQALADSSRALDDSGSEKTIIERWECSEIEGGWTPRNRFAVELATAWMRSQRALRIFIGLNLSESGTSSDCVVLT